MISRFPGPRKRRTRQHVIADLGIHYVEGIVLSEGHTVQRLSPDYGYDLALFTYDENGHVEPNSVMIQVKATESLNTGDSECTYDIDARDYNLWTWERAPVVLVLYDAARKRAYWLHIQRYFKEDASRQLAQGARTVRVRIPISQVLNRKAIAMMREMKAGPQLRVFGSDR